MITGAQLVAPEGFGQLCKGVIYYFLVNDPFHNRVRMVEFILRKEPIPVIFTFTTSEFEEALEAGLIIETGVVEKFPPWLKRIEGVKISHLEECRVSVKESYDEKVNRRFMAIADLVLNAQKFSCTQTLTLKSMHMQLSLLRYRILLGYVYGSTHISRLGAISGP